MPQEACTKNTVQKELGKQKVQNDSGSRALKLLVWVGGQGGVQGRVWATLTVFLSLPHSTPHYKHPASGKRTEERVLDKIDPTGLRIWAPKGMKIPMWRAGQRGVLRKLGFSHFTTQGHSQENWLHPGPECWGRRIKGGRAGRSREFLVVFPRSPLTETEP